MQPSAVCPNCGQLLFDGRCPSCGIVVPPVPAPPTLPKKRNYAPFVIGGIALYVVFVALLAFAGIRMLQRRGHLLASRPSLHHTGPVARPDELKGNGRIYLVQMGEHKDPYSLDDFAQWLRTKYKLDVTVLPPTSIDKSAWHPLRNQYIAESLYAQMKRDHPDLASDPGAYLIGFTDGDMYTVHQLWQSSFTNRDFERAAVISTQGMQDSSNPLFKSSSNIADQHFQARLRRILLKDIAILYWHLPLNSDPSSILHNTLNPNVPTEDIFESDLDPARTNRGQVLNEPCVYFDYSAKLGIHPLPGALVRECADVQNPLEDTTHERFEVDLRLGGLLLDKRTDFYLPDTVPIQFQRITRDGWRGHNPFGLSGSDSYDEYLSSADNMDVDIIHADTVREHLTRQPRNDPNLSRVKYVDTDNPGFYEMRWYATPYERYEVKRFDGAVATYLPCYTSAVFCYLTNFRDPLGNELKFERGHNRRLERLVSPNQSWIHVDYDSAGRIASVTDNHGRTVHYGYDPGGRLITVTYPNGETCHYEYDSTQHLITFTASPNAKTPAQILLRNEYDHDLLMKQTLADGSVYTYSYDSSDRQKIHTATVHSPDGKTFNLKINYSTSVVHEQ